MDKGKIPTDVDRGEYEIGRLKHQIRIMAVVDLAQSCLLVGLVIHIWCIQSSLSSTLRLVTQLSDLVGQLLDDTAQLTLSAAEHFHVTRQPEDLLTADNPD